MVVQTHHYRRPIYWFVAALSAAGGLAILIAVWLGESAQNRWFHAPAGLALMAVATLLWLRFLNECLYFAPGRLIYIDRFGRRQAELPLSQVRRLARGLAATYEIQGRHCRIRFDESITECDALIQELEWQIRSRHSSRLAAISRV